jgi:hypothetical protein
MRLDTCTEDLRAAVFDLALENISAFKHKKYLQVRRRGKVSIKDDVVVVNDDSNNGSHGDTSVLTLNGTTTLESFWLRVQPSQRIKDSEWLGDTKLKLVDIQGGRGLGGGSWGKGSSRGDKEGGNSKLHGEIFVCLLIRNIMISP